MKKLLVVFLAMAMIFAFAATALAADTEIPDYSDLADQKAEWQAAVYRLTALGVLEGNNGVGGAFRPADYITRAELAKMVIYLTGNTDKVAYYAAQAPAYTDVADGFWAEGYINAAKDLGLMKGVGYNKFNPQGTVSFQETATVVLRALGYTDALKGEWPADYSRKAAEIDLTDYVDYIGPKAITRAELSSIFNEGLDKLMVSYIADSTAQSIAQVIALSAAQMDWYFGGKNVDGIGVDADGFAYNIFYTNDDDRDSNSDLLNYAFDAQAFAVQFNDEDGSLSDAPDAKLYGEANAWGYDDFDDGELLVASYDAFYADKDSNFKPEGDLILDEVASLYYIFGGGLADLANMQADITLNDDGEVLFVELTSQKIKVDSWDDDYDNFDDTNNKKIEVGDVKYPVDIDGGFQLNNSEISSTVNSEGGYGYLFVNEDGDAYDYKEYQQYVNAGHHVIDSVDDNYIYYLDSSPAQRISKLDDYVILKDGAFVELADLEQGDVVYQAPLGAGYADFDAVNLIIALSPVTGGDLTKAYTDDSGNATTNDYGFTVDDVKLYGYTSNNNEYCYYSLDGLDSLKDYAPDYDLREEFFDEEVTYAVAYAFRDFVYAAIDIQSYTYGVLVELDYKTQTATTNILTGVTILMADGEEVEYALESNFDNTAFPSNEIMWTAGSFVEFQLNKDGEIDSLADGSPDMKFFANGDDFYFDQIGGLPQTDRFLSRYAPFATFTSEDTVYVDEDDATIEFDNETYDLADDAEIFVVSVDGGEYDDCDIVTAADLLADGNFDVWQIAACYTSGVNGDTIETLWIVGQDLENDNQMGYENGGKYKASGDCFVTLNGTADTPVSDDVYDDWDGRFIVYALDGDTIETSAKLFSFNKTTKVLSIVPKNDPDADPYLDATAGVNVVDPSTLGGVTFESYVQDVTLGTFTLKDGDDDYDITVGVLDGDPDVSSFKLKNAWNGGDSDTYRYTTSSFVFFKDLSDYDTKATDVDDMNDGDTVLIVRDGSRVLYAFRLVDTAKI